MLEDRLCIASNGAINVQLSPEDMVQCDIGNAGCNGGLLSQTIDFLSTEGVVTEGCKPYTSGVGSNGFCSFGCTDWTVEYKKYYCKPQTLKMPTKVEAIQQEIMDNGPIQVGFVIYSDFLVYSSGIYQVVDNTI